MFKHLIRSDTFKALMLAFVVSMGCYFINNCPYPFWDELDMFSIEEHLIRTMLPDDEEKSDDAFFINVGYDQQVVDYDINGWNTGHVSITDRKTLLDLLTIADSLDADKRYQMIFLDIRFEPGYHTEWDSALFRRIIHMPNVYFAHHADVGIVADSLLVKAVRSDYFTTLLNSSFTRYQFIQDGQASAALCIDSIVNHKTIREFGPFYLTDGYLCQNSPVIPVQHSFATDSNDGRLQDSYDLGPFLLQNPEMLQRMMQGRIVIVGDYINDIHPTYRGDMPGSYLIYTAFRFLSDGRHKVSWWFSLFQLLFFTFLFRWSLQGRDLTDLIQLDRLVESRLAQRLHIHRILGSQIVRFALSFLSFDVLLTASGFVLYIMFGIIFNTALPAFVLAVTIYYKKFIKS